MRVRRSVIPQFPTRADLRHAVPPRCPSKHQGHRKAVSYVRWLSGSRHELVTASTDSSLKLWSLAPPASSAAAVDALAADAAAGGAAAGGAAAAAAAASSFRSAGAELVRTFTGHMNERNFVGMCTDGVGDYIACGSESHEVFVYYRSLPQPALSYRFPTRCGAAGAGLGVPHVGTGRGPWVVHAEICGALLRARCRS